jgi:hypothetical protein
MLGNAAVAMWCDVRSEAREELDDWHAHEHMPERLSIPGFLRGSRWVAADAGPGYFILYETDSEATVTGAPYLARLNNPTPWSRKMMPEHRNMVRSLCRREASFGAGVGQALLTVALSPKPGCDEALRTWLRSEMLPGLASRKGLLGAHLLRTIQTPQTARTTEQQIRGNDRAADWVVLVTGYGAKAVAELADDGLNDAALETRGAMHGRTAGVYRLACLMTAADVRAQARLQ